MSIVLGQRSLSRLDGVHPDLARVVKRAASLAEPAHDFTVLEGVRSKEQCWVNYGKGRSIAQCTSKGVPGVYAAPHAAKVTWLNDPLNSKHCKQADGFGHAVDLAPFPIDWNDIPRFDAVAKLMLRAADLEGVSIRWGADWNQDGKPREKGEGDSPHFELAR